MQVAVCCVLCLQGVEFKLEIKNLVLSDSKGCDLVKETVVRVTSALKQVWLLLYGLTIN